MSRREAVLSAAARLPRRAGRPRLGGDADHLPAAGGRRVLRGRGPEPRSRGAASSPTRSGASGRRRCRSRGRPSRSGCPLPSLLAADPDGRPRHDVRRGAGLVGRRGLDRVPSSPGGWPPTSRTARSMPVGRARTLALGTGLDRRGLPAPRPRLGPARLDDALRRARASCACLLMTRLSRRISLEGVREEGMAAFVGRTDRDVERRSRERVALGVVLALAALTRNEAIWLALTFAIIEWSNVRQAVLEAVRPARRLGHQRHPGRARRDPDLRAVGVPRLARVRQPVPGPGADERAQPRRPRHLRLAGPADPLALPGRRRRARCSSCAGPARAQRPAGAAAPGRAAVGGRAARAARTAWRRRRSEASARRPAPAAAPLLGPDVRWSRRSSSRSRRPGARSSTPRARSTCCWSISALLVLDARHRLGRRAAGLDEPGRVARARVRDRRLPAVQRRAAARPMARPRAGRRRGTRRSPRPLRGRRARASCSSDEPGPVITDFPIWFAEATRHHTLALPERAASRASSTSPRASTRRRACSSSTPPTTASGPRRSSPAARAASASSRSSCPTPPTTRAPSTTSWSSASAASPSAAVARGRPLVPLTPREAAASPRGRTRRGPGPRAARRRSVERATHAPRGAGECARRKPPGSAATSVLVASGVARTTQTRPARAAFAPPAGRDGCRARRPSGCRTGSRCPRSPNVFQHSTAIATFRRTSDATATSIERHGFSGAGRQLEPRRDSRRALARRSTSSCMARCPASATVVESDLAQDPRSPTERQAPWRSARASRGRAGPVRAPTDRRSSGRVPALPARARWRPASAETALRGSGPRSDSGARGCGARPPPRRLDRRWHRGSVGQGRRTVLRAAITRRPAPSAHRDPDRDECAHVMFVKPAIHQPISRSERRRDTSSRPRTCCRAQSAPLLPRSRVTTGADRGGSCQAPGRYRTFACAALTARPHAHPQGHQGSPRGQGAH